MSYADEAALAADLDYRARVGAALSHEATGKPGDPLADLCLRSAAAGINTFMPWLSTAPGFGETYASGGQSSITDPDLLAAIQANWDAVAAVVLAE